MGPLNPYGGLDIARVSGSFESSRTDSEYDWSENKLYRSYDRSSTFDGSALLFIPHAGLKFYFWKTYLLGDLSLCIPAVEGKDKGKRTYYNPDGTIYDIDKWEDKKKINDALNFVGLTLGFGIEFPLSEKVSIGGEYGIRLIFNSYIDEGSDQDDDDPPYWEEKWEDKISATLGVTYTSFSLNFILCPNKARH